jgi:hypothetical protein
MKRRFPPRDDSEPSLERQEELRRVSAANRKARKAPYEGVKIETAGELFWITSRSGWTTRRFPSIGFLGGMVTLGLLGVVITLGAWGISVAVNALGLWGFLGFMVVVITLGLWGSSVGMDDSVRLGFTRLYGLLDLRKVNLQGINLQGLVLQ